jgi:hypothetical protein
MSTNLNGRKIQMFRAHIDPMIGPTPRNAFNCKEHGLTAELLPQGVFVTFLKTGQEHLVPFANLQSIKFEPLPKEEVK